MFHPHLNEEEQVLYIDFEGKIEIHEYLSYIKMLGESDALPGHLYVLNDFTKANFGFKPSEIPLIGALLKKYEDRYATVRIAAVYANPKETAYGQLIEKNTNLKNYTHKIFHSLESANEWLKSAISVVS